eukprot:gene4047-gene4446
MRLPALEFLIRIQVGVLVVQTDNHTHQDEVGLHVIQKCAAVDITDRRRLQRPSKSVLNQTRGQIFFGNFPDFLDTDTIRLNVLALAQVELLDKVLRARASTSLCENSMTSMKLNTANKAILNFVAFGDTSIEHLVGREPRVDFNTKLFGLGGKPSSELRQRNDVVSFIVQLLGHQTLRNFQMGVLGEPEEAIMGNSSLDRGALLSPVRNKLVQRSRFENISRQNMSTNFGGLLDNTNTEVNAFLSSQLLHTNGSTQPSRAATHSDDIVKQLLP